MCFLGLEHRGIWFRGVRRYLLLISRQVACRSVRRCGNHCSDCKVLRRTRPQLSTAILKAAAAIPTIQIVLLPDYHRVSIHCSDFLSLAVSTTAEHIISDSFLRVSVNSTHLIISKTISAHRFSQSPHWLQISASSVQPTQVLASYLYAELPLRLPSVQPEIQSNF